jgi:hypothetical protein
VVTNDQLDALVTEILDDAGDWIETEPVWKTARARAAMVGPLSYEAVVASLERLRRNHQVKSAWAESGQTDRRRAKDRLTDRRRVWRLRREDR